jgi:protein-S-isoprenylcysteine O-methyltransferase Ste14
VPLGFLFAAVFLALARPTTRSLLLSLPPVAAGVWLRAYAAGYVRKNTELTTTGPYAHTRNPLYLGSLSIALGFAAAAGSWSLLALLLGSFAAIYWPTIRSEEAFLRERFANFDAYAAAVPRILPRLLPARREETPGTFSGALYRQHREYNCAIGSGAIYAALVLRMVVLRMVVHR